ncbi:MAG: RsmG family class I SAM-dependent methyltransferase, partial [Calditrichia bacterium]
MTSLKTDPQKSPLLWRKQREVKTFFPTISEQQIASLHHFEEALKDWNRRVNLISRKDVDFIWEHHILPSLVALHLHQIEAESWIVDIGSGGGFP